MEKAKETQERQRKEWKRGTRTQKMMAFRVDNELLEWLEAQVNKGRYLNNLIAADMSRRQCTSNGGA